MSDPTTEALQRFADQIVADEKERIRIAIREAADRVIANVVLLPEFDEDDELLDRQDVVEQFGVPYWKIRDLQIEEKIPMFKKGKKVVSRKSDILRVLAIPESEEAPE